MMEPVPSSQIVAKRPSDGSLMPPPPPPKRIKRPSTVLDEDTYTDTLSHIIARDFFPSLLETRTKREFLAALDSKDKTWIATAGRKLSEIMTPGRLRGRRGAGMTPEVIDLLSDATPAGRGGDTPMSTATSALAQASQGPSADILNLNLSAFQAKHTSEDNESFNRLLDKQNAKRREKYAWMWSENKILSARQIAYRQREAKRIAAQGGNLESTTGKELLLKSDLDVRPAKPDTWKSSPANPLMFTPSSIEDTHETLQQKAEIASRAGSKHVVYDNTRLPPVKSEATPPPSPSISTIEDAIAGRPRLTDSEAGLYLKETPQVNGYAFVDEDEPTEDIETQLKLLVASTQGSGDSSPNPFKIRENRRREELHHRMVERVARTKRAEKAASDTKAPIPPRLPSSPTLNFGLIATPSNNSNGGGRMLTPAAQKLLQRVGSTPRPSASVSSSSLRNMWTPTPKKTK